MREISVARITETVARLCQEANFFLPEDVLDALNQAMEKEQSPLAQETLWQILQNAHIAAQEHLPLCQDCGSTVVLVEIGQEVHLVGGDLYSAIDEGVRRGYTQGFLRKSTVRRPLTARENTRDNTPAVIHLELVPGDKLRLVVMPKGGGAENMSHLFMLSPAEGQEGIQKFVVKAVEKAGSNPCPPVIVGVGIGGTAEKAMMLAKKALLRPVGEANADPEIAELEQQILTQINALGIGTEGFGGYITALAVHIETFPCHIASLPVAVNLQCHSARHKEAMI